MRRRSRKRLLFQRGADAFDDAHEEDDDDEDDEEDEPELKEEEESADLDKVLDDEEDETEWRLLRSSGLARRLGCLLRDGLKDWLNLVVSVVEDFFFLLRNG